MDLNDELMREREGMRVSDRGLSNADVEKLGFAPQEMQDPWQMWGTSKEALRGARHAMHIPLQSMSPAAGSRALCEKIIQHRMGIR